MRAFGKIAAAVCVASLLLAACGGGSDGSSPPATNPGSAVVGAQGGTIRGEAGAEVRIPPDALPNERTIRIARDATDMPPLPPGTVLISDAWAITPHDTATRIPMTVRIPFDASLLRAGERPVVLKGSTDGQWQLIEDVTVEGSMVAVQVRSFSFLLVRGLPSARVIPPAGTPPSSTQPSFTVSVENPGFQTLPVTNFTAMMRLQQLPNEPVNVQYSLRVPAGSAANDVCTFGATRNPIYAFRHTIPVAIYRLPGDGAGVNRLSAYFRGASMERLLVNPAGTTEEAQYSVLPDRDYVVRQAVSALDYQWRADAGNPFPYTYDWANSLPGELPANATVDSWGVMVKLVISCASGLPAFASTAPPVVIARGFPNDKLFFNGPPTLNAAFPGQLATGQINVTIDPTHVSAGYRWQIRGPGASSWTNVPQIISATQPPGVSIWSGDNAIGFVPQASDNGAELRVEACVDPAGSGLGIGLLRECYMSPVGRVTVSNQFPTPRIVIQPGPAAFRVNDTFYLRAEYEAFPLPQTVAGIVWQTRANASQPWSALPVPVNINVNPWPQLPTSTVFRAVDLRNDRGVTELMREFAQPATVADRGRQYRLILSLNNTTLTSNVVTIAVDSGVAPPRFTVQPADVQAQAGSAATLTAAVEGGAPLSYRWLFNGQPILGANAPTLALPTVNSGNAGQYQLEVSNADATIRSTAARLSVTAAPPPVVTAPSIGTQPAALTVVAGSTATFTVTASGTAPFRYEWRRNGATITGSTDQVLTLSNVGAADAGDYSVVVTNNAGSTISNNAALTISTVTPPSVVAPAISTQPVGLSVNPGQTATLAVAASGTGPLAHKWQRNGSNVPGATGPVLTLANVQTADAGNYTVTVTNSAGSVTSNVAGLVVTSVPGAPIITAQPANRSVLEGQRATFSLAVAGNPTPQCQWTRNSVAIQGAISCTGYTTPDTASADNGALYNVVVYSPGGVAIGNGAVLTVSAGAAVPVITQDVADVTAPEGGTATFSVVASANGPLFHYWTRIGAPTTPLGGSTFDIGPLQASDNGATVRVIVCNGPIANNRCTTSRDARLTVTAITLNAALLAGTPGTSGSADGTGTAARFNTANYVTANPTTGTIYIGDFGNSTIRTVTPGGVVSTLAGAPGSFAFADGTGSAARFNGNGGLALDAAGNLFVADWDNFLVRRVTAAGVVTTLAGSPGSAGSTDGTGAAARFVNPNGLAIDTAGNVYAADWGNATIRRITPAGVVTTLAGTPGSPGSADGTGAAARFSQPTGVAVDSAGNVYVADQGNNTIRRITQAGVVTTLAGLAGSSGSTDGTGSAARFTSPSVLSISPTGDLFVIAGVNGETVRKITAAGVVTTVVGVAGQASAVVLGANPRLRNGRAVHAISSNRLLVTADNALLDITVP